MHTARAPHPELYPHYTDTLPDAGHVGAVATETFLAHVHALDGYTDIVAMVDDLCDDDIEALRIADLNEIWRRDGGFERPIRVHVEHTTNGPRYEIGNGCHRLAVMLRNGVASIPTIVLGDGDGDPYYPDSELEAEITFRVASLSRRYSTYDDIVEAAMIAPVSFEIAGDWYETGGGGSIGGVIHHIPDCPLELAGVYAAKLVERLAQLDIVVCDLDVHPYE